MTGNCYAARTIANPIRCVKEIFLPLAASPAFSSLRRASSVSTTTSRKEVAVGTDSESVMFWTRRAAGPVIGVRPGLGVRGSGLGACACIPGPGSRGPRPATSSRLVGITGSSATLPLSNRLRHSSPTEAGSRRYCSYITCTKAALWVPKTNSLTEENLTVRPALRVARPAAARFRCGPEPGPVARRARGANRPGARHGGRSLLPQPRAPRLDPHRGEPAPPCGEHDEAAGDDPDLPGRGRRAVAAR